MGTFNLIGVYRVMPTPESIISDVKYYGFDWLLDERGQFRDEIHWNNFEELGLLEIQIFGNFSPEIVSHISQNEQAPYMEFYLDPAGILRISEDEAIRTDGRRLCFFLQFIDSSEQLLIEDEVIVLGKMSDLPARLAGYAHYVPVD